MVIGPTQLKYSLALQLTTGTCLLLSIGCASILDLERAECDQRLEDCQTEGDTNSDEAGAPLTGSPPSELTCSSYCEDITQACQGNDLQFTTVASCEAICPSIPLGDPDDTDVDSLYCRQRRLNVALNFGEEDEECQRAGLIGAGACGDVCDVFCRVFRERCTETFEEDGQVYDFDQCEEECRSLPGPTDLFNPDPDPANTFECRSYHLHAAFGEPRPHCEHSAGLAICVDE